MDQLLQGQQFMPVYKGSIFELMLVEQEYVELQGHKLLMALTDLELGQEQILAGWGCFRMIWDIQGSLELHQT